MSFGFWLIATWLLPCGLFAAANPDFPEAEIKLLPPYAELPPTFWEQHDRSVLIGALVLLAVIGIVLWLRLRPKALVAVPPDVRAIQALAPLRGRAEDGKLLTQVTQLLRTYFIAAFHFPSGEPTTAEFCRMLSASNSVDGKLKEDVTGFLRDCDERKFSPSTSVPNAPRGVADTAIDFIQQAEQQRAAQSAPTRA